MPTSRDPAVDRRDHRSARLFQLVFPISFRLRYSSRRLQFATKPIARPRRVVLPTRHGEIGALVYSPTADDLARTPRPPVHLLTHGGAFIIRAPRQEDNVARYLASEVGCHVVVPDYDTAPRVRFPVAEEQVFDDYRWVRANGAAMGWDGDRVSVGGASAGGKLAVNVALQAVDAGEPVPVAVTSEFGMADGTFPDEQRTSTKARPVVSRELMGLVRRTYFAGVDLHDPLASPALHPRLSELPPTLILTGELDTLRHEMQAFAADLAARGVAVTSHDFAGVDHGFTHTKPVETARRAIEMIGDHLRVAYERSQR